MKTLIINGGSIEDDFAVAYVRSYAPDYVIAADSGMEFCYRSKLRPNCIIGDFDSVNPEVLSTFREQADIEWRDYIPEKDYTDSEIAVCTAMEKGSTCIHILGATGSRLDHVIGSIQLLSKIDEAGIEGRIIDANNRIRVIHGRTVLTKENQFGKYVSILPLSTRITGITLTGFKYPLHLATITSDNTLGISNEIVEAEAVVDFDDGVAIIIEARD